MDNIAYVFEKDGENIAKLVMPKDIECFSVIGDLMGLLGVPFVIMEKEDS